MINNNKNTLEVSVLIAVHHAINPIQVRVSIESIFLQKNIPNQIIIIVDGAIGIELSEYLSHLNLKYNQIVIFYLKENKGLAYALNYGLQKSNYELIARLDPDDMVVNNRFFEQKKEFDKNQTLSVCGSYVQETYKNNKKKLLKKPSKDNEIKVSLKTKNPIIHSTVMFKKSDIQSIGGYPSIYKCQDYLLWIKCMENHLIFKNIDKAFVISKLDKSLMKRRDLNYFRFEKIIYNYMLEKKIINKYFFYFNIFFRFVLRSLPYPLKFLLYQIR